MMTFDLLIMHAPFVADDFFLFLLEPARVQYLFSSSKALTGIVIVNTSWGV